MDDIRSSNLKTILHSKRANIYYLEYCRVLVNGGRVEYVTDEGKRSLYWNIPIANTTTLLLGTGTSLTQAAVRELAKAGVQIGFCGGGGTPLFAGYERERAPDETLVENEPEAEGMREAYWLSPQSEYRPMEYCQAWMRFWFEEAYRLMAAKAFQERRIGRIIPQWRRLNRKEAVFAFDEAALSRYLEISREEIAHAPDVGALLQAEARLTKRLYALAAQAVEIEAFTRAKRGTGTDLANNFLDHGNYLAYGLAATASWVLGIPHSFPVLHGKTRRGGLVFDIADLIKDSTILPLAFLCAREGKTEQQFRAACIDLLTRSEALDFMIETLKNVAMTTGRLAANDGGMPRGARSARLDYVTTKKDRKEGGDEG